MTSGEDRPHAESSSISTLGPKRTWAPRWLRSGLTVGLLASLLLIGWVAARVFQSPDQRAAAARPPAERSIVAPVTRGELVDRLNVRAHIGFELEDVIASPASVEGYVVTEMFLRLGDEVRAGTAIIALNDRPVFILPGEFPFYRDIEPGMEGQDVKQLQAAIRMLGYSIPSYEDGRYGWATRRAVAEMYAASGFDQVTMADPRAEAGGPSTSASPSQIGPVLPMSEVIVARELPGRLVDLPNVGERIGPSNGFVTVASGPLVARAEVDAAAAVKLRVGMSATLMPDGGDLATATITTTYDESAGAPSPGSSTAAAPAAAGGAGSSVMGAPGAVVFTPVKPVPPEWLGKNVLVEVRIQQVAGGVELLVPERAISSSTDGSQRVFVRHRALGGRAGENFVRVNVEVVGSLAGQAAIRPVADGALAEGDEVRVG